jgi:hypothetical protein
MAGSDRKSPSSSVLSAYSIISLRGLANRYVVVPMYVGPEDAADPLVWVGLVERAAGLHTVEKGGR